MKMLPGPTPDMSKPIKQGIKVTNALVGDLVDKKVETTIKQIRN